MMCVAEGRAVRGARCNELSFDPLDLCQPPLSCFRGACSSSCRSDTDCKAGENCAHESAGPGVCLVTCTPANCHGENKECINIGWRDLCAVRVGKNCLTEPCAVGSVCELNLEPGLVGFWCAQPCNPFDAGSCPGGHVCGAGRGTDSVCYPSCSPSVPCADGFACVNANEDFTLFGCIPSLDD